MAFLYQEWKAQIRSYSRNLRLFLFFSFVWNLGLGMFGIVYNLYVKALGFNQTTVGDIVGMSALAAALTLIPAGIMNDKFGPKRMIIIGLFSTLVALAARTLLISEQGLLVSAFIGGMSLAIVSATILPFMANQSTVEQRVHLISLNMAFMMMANVIGIIMGGLLSDVFQFFVGLTGLWSLRLTLLIGIALAALSVIPVLFLKQTDIDHKQDIQAMALIQKWKLHKSSFQVIGLFLIIGLLTSTAGGMVVPYLNIYFEDRFHSSKTMIGLIVAMGQGATALALFIGPVFSRRYGEVKSVVVLQLCSVPFLLITAYSTSLYLACSGYLFRQALMNASNPYYSSIKMRYVDRSLRGLAASSGEAVYNLGWFLAAPLSSSLVVYYGSYYGYAYSFTITAVVYILVSCLFYVFFGKERFKPADEIIMQRSNPIKIER